MAINFEDFNTWVKDESKYMIYPETVGLEATLGMKVDGAVKRYIVNLDINWGLGKGTLEFSNRNAAVAAFNALIQIDWEDPIDTEELG